jgi:hypothetical protein
MNKQGVMANLMTMFYPLTTKYTLLDMLTGIALNGIKQKSDTTPPCCGIACVNPLRYRM